MQLSCICWFADVQLWINPQYNYAADYSYKASGNVTGYHYKGDALSLNPKYSRVLVVEDESIVLLGFKAFLTQLGYQVVGETNNGKDAIELCRSLNPDFLIMDIKMPELDGIQALERINQSRRLKIPCIFVTAYSDENLISQAKKAGAFSYLIKPIRIQDLHAAIDVMLEQYEAYLALANERDRALEQLESRKLIERAKGYLMDSFNMKEKQAMEFLQKKSRNTNKKLVEVASSILKMADELKG